MEKIRKKRQTSWTRLTIVVILCTLNFSGNLCLGQADAEKEIKPIGVDVKSGESLELREAEVFRESAENRILELELEKEKLGADYKKLRSRYAELYVSTHKAVRRLRELELRAVDLIQGGESSAGNSAETSEMANPEEGRGAGQEALEALELVLAKQVELQDALEKFKDYFTATLDVLQPSGTVRDELMKRLDTLQSAVDNSARPLMTAAMAGNSGSARNSSVISVNDEFQLVVLDKGTLAGVRPGGRWKQLGRDGEIEARLVVVEARAEVSAAVLLEGELSSLRAGNILEREENTWSEKAAETRMISPGR